MVSLDIYKLSTLWRPWISTSCLLYDVPGYLQIIHLVVSLNTCKFPFYGVPEYLQGVHFMLSLNTVAVTVNPFLFPKQSRPCPQQTDTRTHTLQQQHQLYV